MRMVHEYGRGNGRGWIDNQQDCPEGEPRGQAMLVKITEDVRKYAAEQQVSDEPALQSGMEEKSRGYGAWASRFAPKRSGSALTNR